MPQIEPGASGVTQITIVDVEPGKGDEALALMRERARFMKDQDGFVSVSLHRSRDGRRIVNYVQWESAEKLSAAHHAPEFRDKWPKMSEVVGEAEPQLFEVVETFQK